MATVRQNFQRSRKGNKLDYGLKHFHGHLCLRHLTELGNMQSWLCRTLRARVKLLPGNPVLGSADPARASQAGLQSVGPRYERSGFLEPLRLTGFPGLVRGSVVCCSGPVGTAQNVVLSLVSRPQRKGS